MIDFQKPIYIPSLDTYVVITFYKDMFRFKIECAMNDDLEKKIILRETKKYLNENYGNIIDVMEKLSQNKILITEE